MPGSLFLRTLRGATLFAAGMLVAGTGISTGAPTTAATTYTRVASCSGLNFHPIDHRTEYTWEGRVLFRRTDQGDGWFLCDPHLPHKAVVTRVRFTVRDASSEVSVQHCALRRASLGIANAESQVLGAVSATGFTPVPGTVRRSDTSISRATIDNSAYGYWLQCQLAWTEFLNLANVPLAAIIGADVTYKISSTNG